MIRRTLREIQEPGFRGFWQLPHGINNVLKILRALAESKGPLSYYDLMKKTGLSKSTIMRNVKKLKEASLTATNYDISYDEYPWLHDKLFGKRQSTGPGRPGIKIVFTPSLGEELREEVSKIVERKRKKQYGSTSFEEFPPY